MYDTAPKGRPQMLNLLRFVAIFSFISILPPLILPSPLSSPTSLLFHLTPLLSFAMEVNKKLSYRGQNALSVITNTNALATAKICCIYQYVSLDWPDGRIMLSTCPFVCPSVRSL